MNASIQVVPVGPSDKITIGLNEYIYGERKESGYVFVSVNDKSEEVFVSNTALNNYMLQGDLEIVKGVYRDLKYTGLMIDAPSIAKLPHHLRFETLERHSIRLHRTLLR
ncbi:MAG: hypothetical protein O9296_05285 [Novosphingobium sp.]|nr:hypothetical protein [Novosphingobium sp.]